MNKNVRHNLPAHVVCVKFGAKWPRRFLCAKFGAKTKTVTVTPAIFDLLLTVLTRHVGTETVGSLTVGDAYD